MTPDSIAATVQLKPVPPPETLAALRRELLLQPGLEAGARFTLSVPIAIEVEVTRAAPARSAGKSAPRVDLTIASRSATQTTAPPASAPPFRATVTPDARLRAKWDSIAGCDELKTDLVETAALLMERRAALAPLAAELGFSGKWLFAGGQGVGKSSLGAGLADALSRRLGASVLLVEVNAATLLSKFVGESAKNVKALFDAIRAEAAGYECTVVLLDEADAIAGDRAAEQEHNDAKRAVNALLVELESIGPFEERVLVVAATNLAERLDPAARRRFQRVVRFPDPDASARAEIFRGKLARVRDALADEIAVDLDEPALDRLASASEGYTGSDIARVLAHALAAALRARAPLDEQAVAAALATVRPAREGAPG